MELSLADVLDGLIGRAGRGHRTRIQFWIRELPGERNIQALNIGKPICLEELLTRTGRPSATIAAWLPTFSAAASRNGASAQAPGEIFR